MDKFSPKEIEEAGGSEDLNWDDFRVFLEVVRTGSFNRAAAKLNMTQATVSRRLARLEAQIGVRLFDRDRRGPRLTFEGQRIFNDTSAAHFALTRAAHQGAGAASRLEGDCKIVVGDGLAAYWMARFLPAFYTRYPGIELKLFGAFASSADNRVLFDLQIEYDEPSGADRAALRLGAIHFIPFASMEYLRRNGVPRTLEDLERHRLLDRAIFLAGLGSWAPWRENKRTALYTDLSTCVGEAVRHGAGIGLLPTYAATIDPAFAPIEIGIRFRRPIFVSYQRDAPKNWAVSSTIEFLKQTVFDLKTMPWFREEFEFPSASWDRVSAALVAEALERAGGNVAGATDP